MNNSFGGGKTQQRFNGSMAVSLDLRLSKSTKLILCLLGAHSQPINFYHVALHNRLYYVQFNFIRLNFIETIDKYIKV